MDTIFVHGGFDLNNVLDDFYSYNFKTNEWNFLHGSSGTKYENKRWLFDDLRVEKNPEQPIFQTSSTELYNNSVDTSFSVAKNIQFSKVNSTTVSVKMFANDDLAALHDMKIKRQERTYGNFDSINNTVFRKRRSPMMP